MSGIVEHEEAKAAEAEFRNFLVDLVAKDELGGAALGVTKLVIEKGRDALSEKQSYAFRKAVLEPYSAHCDQCYRAIRWSEAYEYFHSPGRCQDCEVHYEAYMAKD
ncbi:MAG: hypothetical protein E5Y88_12280 [Mesorhizobium sp.]|uniref:hypothetical protein n=1 Tax=Mesorhizobium sp. TaxID=1871066 RepID=UPI0012200140|nr:hypothetical protein [Mesorhizobium sp.]TIL25719.1 MAG: hypothetical protein E5Y88_12280 [Mesorhizobium sp.]